MNLRRQGGERDLGLMLRLGLLSFGLLCALLVWISDAFDYGSAIATGLVVVALVAGWRVETRRLRRRDRRRN